MYATLNAKILLFPILLCALALAACSDSSESTDSAPQAQANEELTSGPVPVEAAELIITNQAQPRVMVQIGGHFPNGCTNVGEIVTAYDRDARRAEVTFMLERTEVSFCTQALVPFARRVTLDYAELSEGDWIVDVHGNELALEVTTAMLTPVTARD